MKVTLRISDIFLYTEKKSLLSQTNWRLRVANLICCQLKIIFNETNTVSLFSGCEIIHSMHIVFKRQHIELNTCDR